MKRQRDQQRNQERKETFYQSVKNGSFKTGGLRKSDLKKLPTARKKEYLEQELRRRFGKIIHYTCEECALRIVYNEKGEVTDEELIDLNYD